MTVSNNQVDCVNRLDWSGVADLWIRALSLPSNVFPDMRETRSGFSEDYSIPSPHRAIRSGLADSPERAFLRFWRRSGCQLVRASSCWEIRVSGEGSDCLPLVHIADMAAGVRVSPGFAAVAFSTERRITSAWETPHTRARPIRPFTPMTSVASGAQAENLPAMIEKKAR